MIRKAFSRGASVQQAPLRAIDQTLDPLAALFRSTDPSAANTSVEATVVMSVLDGAFWGGLTPGEGASLSEADEKRSGSPGDRMRCLIMRQCRKGTCTARQAVSLPSV